MRLQGKAVAFILDLASSSGFYILLKGQCGRVSLAGFTKRHSWAGESCDSRCAFQPTEDPARRHRVTFKSQACQCGREYAEGSSRIHWPLLVHFHVTSCAHICGQVIV